MAFKEVADLSFDVVISLGGRNKKTNKDNPNQIEGYYLGSKQVPDKKKKSGVGYIHGFSTSKGNIGVWGKTDMDKKLNSATVGAMTRVTHNGFRNTPNGEMYVYKVEVDADNMTDGPTLGRQTLSGSNNSSSSEDTVSEDTYAELADSADEDETPASYVAPAPPARAAAVATSAAQAKMRALLSQRK